MSSSSVSSPSWQLNKLIRFSLLYVALLILGGLIFVAWMYTTGSTTVDYGYAQAEAAYEVHTGFWSQGQADAWLAQHAQLFWREVWERSRWYLLLALAVLLMIVAYARVLPSRYRSQA